MLFEGAGKPCTTKYTQFTLLFPYQAPHGSNRDGSTFTVNVNAPSILVESVSSLRRAFLTVFEFT